jgi:hypothetical protein
MSMPGASVGCAVVITVEDSSGRAFDDGVREEIRRFG